MSGLVVGITGLALTAGTTTASFIQAGKQRSKQRNAENEARRKMDEARAQLEKNYMASLAVPLQAYEQELENINVQTAAATQAAIEGDQRGVGPTAGIVQQASIQAQQQQRAQIAQDLYNLEAATMEEASRLRDIGVGLDLEEVGGAQMAAADAGMAAAQATQAGIQGIANTAQQGLDMVPLFPKSAGQRKLKRVMDSDPNFQKKYAAQYDPTGEMGLLGMSPMEFRATLGEQGLRKKDVRGFVNSFTPPEQQEVFNPYRFISPQQKPFLEFGLGYGNSVMDR
tara:strand:+ start:235 stop:1083 length:849 start_codon:yes stop_codon:yes gene_type:complete